jgi:DNA-binding transcriptional MerR regulator
MLIGDLVNKTGLSKDTIRYYEKQGLIKIGRKDRRENNYKEYPESVVKDLQTIKRLKILGFTLNEINDFLALAQNNLASCARMSSAMTAKLQSIDDKITELTALRTMITGTFTNLKDCCVDIPNGQNCGVFDMNMSEFDSKLFLTSS